MPSELTEASRHRAETDIPDLHGRTAVVTRASTGLGFEAAGMRGRIGRGHITIQLS